MLCPKCGFYSEKTESVCPECGTILLRTADLHNEGIQALRQGKRAREAAKSRPTRAEQEAAEKQRTHSGASHATIEMPAVRDTRSSDGPKGDNSTGEEPQDGGVERRRRTVYDETADEITAMKYLAAHEGGGSEQRMVNWMRIAIIATLIFAVAAVGGYFFLKKTDAGQRLLARMGKDASSVALWAVGDEYMNSGEIEKAIECFEQAKAKDEKDEFVDVDGLLMLASAYEALERIDDAAKLYEEIYTKTPSRTEAYVNHIRILMNSGDSKDKVKAGDLMLTAYKATGDKTFQTQREDLLPSPPKVNVVAAYYETKKTLIFTSYEGFDVYFTFDDDAVLPYGGMKATKEGYLLEEGVYNMRAVAVDGDLVSDELKGTYKIIMPSPQTPRATLAPNTYKTRQKVKLKPGLDDEKDSSIVIYYTIDGSNPDSDSPIFEGEPIQLPNGWVTLKAIAVNRYRKLSNMLEVKYKIEANPKPKSVFDADDTIDKLKIYSSNLTEIIRQYGEGTAAGSVELEGFDAECRKYEYSWGYVVVTLSKKNWILAQIHITNGAAVKGPRETKIGDPADYVVGQFKDMLQVESKSGNRGLYNTGKEIGKIWVQENGEKIIRYRYAVDSHWVQLEYLINKAGNVASIDLRYIP